MKKKVQKSSALDVASENLEDIFTTAFKETVSDSKGDVSMDELECTVEKDLAAETVTMKVTVSGLAGTTPKHVFHDKKTGKIAKGFKKIQVGDCSFKFDTSYDLNTNDYVLVYVAE